MNEDKKSYIRANQTASLRLPSVTESIEEVDETSLRKNRSTNNLRVTINATPEEIGVEESVSQGNNGAEDRSTSNLALDDQSPRRSSMMSILRSSRQLVHRFRPESSVSTTTIGELNENALRSVEKNRRVGDDLISSSLSAHYAKMIVIIGIALPMTAVLTNRINATIYGSFYLYLYTVSIAFVIYVYAYHMRRGASHETQSDGVKRQTANYGSFYLRIGAISFGIGSMVYDGLELGYFFEKYHNADQCGHTEIALDATTIIARMLLSIIQMQFLFLNTTEFDMGRHKVICRFGLMHMLATNLSEWLLVLVEETKHDINHYEESHSVATNHSDTVTTPSPPVINCHASVMAALVKDAAPFLFPCAIEYSLICAVILFEMFKHVKSIPSIERHRRNSIRSRSSVVSPPSNVHQFSLDCSESHRGLFAGILVTVLTIICLIMYFVFHKLPDHSLMAIHMSTYSEIILYILMAFAVLVAVYKMRDLKFLQKKDDHHQSTVEMDCTLLIVAQSGVYLYSVFSIIGSFFHSKDNIEGSIEAIFNEFLCLFQTSIQTLFILNASWRKCKGNQQHRTKPGRQMVTFLLIANMSMWIIYTLIKSVSSFRPDHLEFYGEWAWTVITHVSMPLAIFYRFHSSICLFEIWRSVYKSKESAH